MASSPRKKRLYLVAGLMLLLVLGLLWHAGMLVQGSRSARRADAKTLALQPHPAVVTKKISASAAGVAHAAEGQPPAVIRKKLPPMPSPAPIAEPPPAASAPVSEPVTVVQEKPKELTRDGDGTVGCGGPACAREPKGDAGKADRSKAG